MPADKYSVGFPSASPARKLGRLALALVAVALLALPAAAGAHPFHPRADTPVTRTERFGGLSLARIGSYDFPTYVAAPRDDATRQFVVEQGGKIKLIRNGQPVARPFLNIGHIVEFSGQDERGLLSMAFAPDYATSGLFYVMYTEEGGDLRVDQFQRASSNPDVASGPTRRRVIEVEHSARSNHNGGQIQFAPSGGSLYISTGDGGGGGDPDRNGQDRDSLLGKILRVNPRRTGTQGYTVPADNPFVRRPGRDEIWHYGLRNPARFSFDRATGSMAIGDVGQNAYEEVDFVAPGDGGNNFGWNCFEGRHVYFSGCNPSNDVFPELEYSHEGESCSVTGGYVVRDPGIPALNGRYLYGDYCTGALHAAHLRDGVNTPESRNHVLGLIVPELTSFGEDSQGRIYATSSSFSGRQGAVYQLRAAP